MKVISGFKNALPQNLAVGDIYFCTDTHESFLGTGPTTPPVETDKTLIIPNSGTLPVAGAPGATGQAGAVGAAGPQGPQGPQGGTGPRGDTGPSPTRRSALVFSITGLNGGATPITAGAKTSFPVPFACAVRGWTLFGDTNGNILVDVRKTDYAHFPSNFVSIAGADIPTLAGTTKAENLAVSQWQPGLVATDIVEAIVTSNDIVGQISLTLALDIY